LDTLDENNDDGDNFNNKDKYAICSCSIEGIGTMIQPLIIGKLLLVLAFFRIYLDCCSIGLL